MKKLLLIVLFLSQGAFAQAVVFLEINDTLQKPKYQEFIYLNENTDISGTVRVAKIKAVGSQDNPALLYNLIKGAAQKAGANAFRLVQIDKFPDETAELTLETFYANDSILGVNFHNIEKNRAYIFGDQNLLETKTQSCKVNNQKYELKAGHYLKFPVLPGSKLEIRKGSIGGTVVKVDGTAGKSSKFYSLKGFQITGGDASNDHAQVNFSTGDIVQVEPNLALLLLKIFDEQIPENK
ncbi:MAG: hypothetical protein EOO48_10250 [Flavobacterium sp.]|nr:MAG: hypothetical protein EOO48_10250 [Flavobacterium sp.]